MKSLKLYLFFTLLLTYCAEIKAQNIVVDDTYTAQQLIENVLVNSPCANASNFAVSGDTFSIGQQSYGYFSYTGTDFPFSNGIVLSTSRAWRTAGPNNNLIDEGSTQWTGDIDLEQALGINGTFNATVLEFDFVPITNTISFNYLFASEEYQGTAPCRYSDGFAFLLKVAGSQDQYENLALIPGTSTPVKVTSVHPVISGANGCAAQNEAYFGSYNGSTHPINFNGQTVVMTAQANVIPGLTYHIKLVIADEENIRYDSAIFLEGSSFNVGVDLGPDRLIANQNPICFGENYTLDATIPGINTYQWFKDGISIPAATNPTYNVTSSGTYTVEITLNSTSCIATGEVDVEFTAPLLTNNIIAYQCDDNNDGITYYNLTSLNNLLSNSTDNTIVYYESLTNAQNQFAPISQTNSYQNLTTNKLYARVTSPYGCVAFAEIDLQISNNTLSPTNPLVICDSDAEQDGISTFTISDATPNILSGLPSGLIVKYYPTSNDALLQTNEISSNYTNSVAFQQIVYARIINGSDCYGILPLTLKVNTFNPANFDDENVTLCDGDQISIGVSSGFNTYLWNNGATSNSILIDEDGTYSVTVTDSNGCEKTKTFTAIYSSIATIESVTVSDFNGINNSITITPSGTGDYEYSIDGYNFQDNATFIIPFPDVYTVYVRDKNGCGIVNKEVTVLDYPKFFTPNGDGYNELWFIKNMENYPKAVVKIFDRFGKLMYSFNKNQSGWNGSYNKNIMPATDYWFVLDLGNGKIIKGNFSLKR
jgi:gliding motility-associated-like protein